MRKLKSIALIIFMLNPIFAMSDSIRRDGNFWREIKPSEQFIYLAGVLDGSNLGKTIAAAGCYDNNSPDNQDAQACSYITQKNHSKGFSRYLGKVTVSQIHDGINAFYSDFKNRNIGVDVAVFIILKQIAGDPHIETFIENSRAISASE